MNTTGRKHGGRQKGTPNRQTKGLRGWLTAFVEGNTAQIEKDWKELEPKDRIILFEKLMNTPCPSCSLSAVPSALKT